MNPAVYYQRHQPMFSLEELAAIREMVVLIAGAGGLGTHQAVELQRIGVKKIYLVDFDKVEPSNLNRQILYGVNDLGRLKAERAKEALDCFRLPTEVVALNQRVGPKMRIPDDVQVILSALDSFASRFDLESVAAKHNLPVIEGGVQSCHGQVFTYLPGKTPSLKEIVGEVGEEEYPKPAYSPVVSVIASVMVIEGVKVLLGREDTLTNRMALIDLRNYSIELINL